MTFTSAEIKVKSIVVISRHTLYFIEVMESIISISTLLLQIIDKLLKSRLPTFVNDAIIDYHIFNHVSAASANLLLIAILRKMTDTDSIGTALLQLPGKPKQKKPRQNFSLNQSSRKTVAVRKMS